MGGIAVPGLQRETLAHLGVDEVLRGLEARGHAIELLVVDEEGRHDGVADPELREHFVRFFGPMAAGLRRADADSFPGADVVLATGWQTVPTVLRLPGARARAYLVQDHEPDFYAASIEREWAAWTYGQGLHAICASPWLADVVRKRYGATASSFDLGVLPAEALASAYAQATVGLVLSLTNPSLVPTEMLACGLPVVDLAVDSMVSTFSTDGPLELAAPHPVALADALERLLDDLVLRAQRSRAGTAFVQQRTWAGAAEQVEAGLRAALAQPL